MARESEAPIRLPKISDGTGRRGISGYRGNVEVYDPTKEKARIQKLSAKAAQAPAAETADEKPKATKKAKK